MKKIIGIIVLLLMYSFIAGADTVDSLEEIFPETLTLEEQPGDDDVLEITYGEARKALYYKEMYLVARDYILKIDPLLEKARDLSGDLLDTVRQKEEEIHLWQTGMVFLGFAFTGLSLYTLLR